MNSLYTFQIDMQKFLNKEIKLAAIWLEKPVSHSEFKCRRMVKGYLIRVGDYRVVDVTNEKPATHKITDCKGNISGSILFFELEDLTTGETLILNMKS